MDLLRQLLQFNPDKRITAEQALEHPYVSQFHNPQDEPACEREIKIAIDDDHKYCINDYRTVLYNVRPNCTATCIVSNYFRRTS